MEILLAVLVKDVPAASFVRIFSATPLFVNTVSETVFSQSDPKEVHAFIVPVVTCVVKTAEAEESLLVKVQL